MDDARELWRAIFGSDAPVEIEIGSGDGALLIALGTRAPTRNFLGIERSPAKAERLAARLARLGRPNLRVLQADATCLVTTLIPAASIAAYHVYFPDPWPKRGHAHRRILTASFVAGVARTLMPGGSLFLATDVEGYAAVARERVLADGGFREAGADEDHPGLGTSFARKYRAVGRTLHAFTFVRLGAGDQPLAPSKIRSM